MTPEVYLAAVGLVTLAAGYLAGRSTALARAVAAYEGLVERLSTEVDRLRAWVLDLETTVKLLSAANDGRK